MTKTLDSLVEVISSSAQHPFRKTDSHPKKAQKNRYERRKVKGYLHLGDWNPDQQQAAT